MVQLVNKEFKAFKVFQEQLEPKVSQVQPVHRECKDFKV
jgi:hypothetical protein